MASSTRINILNAREILSDEDCFVTFLKRCPAEELVLMMRELCPCFGGDDQITTDNERRVVEIVNAIKDLSIWFECSSMVADIFEKYDSYYHEFYKPHIEKMIHLAGDSTVILRDFIRRHNIRISRGVDKEKSFLVSLAADGVLNTRPRCLRIGEHLKRNYTRLYHFWFYDDSVLLSKIYNKIRQKEYSKARLLRICSSHSFKAFHFV
jgi:hypothetical protein